MARGIQKWSEAVVERFEKEGRGQGEGVEYKPWINVGEFSSRGRTHDPVGIKVPRAHQLFSDNEYHFFLMLEYAADVVDVREQFPLPRDKTMEVAMQLKARHPFYPGTHVPMVMTVDFMVTKRRQGELVLEGFNVKETAEAEDERSMDKLEIQRETLARMGIEHHLVFSTLLPEQKVRNLAWARGAQLRPGEKEPYEGFFEEHMAALADDLSTTTFDGSLAKYCRQFDSRAGTAAGTTLRAARMLMARRSIEFDLGRRDPERAHVSNFTVAASTDAQRLWTAERA